MTAFQGCRGQTQKGGRLVKEANIEAETKNKQSKIAFQFLCVMAFFPLEMP